MVKEIGHIKLYSVQDLHEALGVNERTLRMWLREGRLRGIKLSGEWHVSEENLKKFLNAEETETKESVKRKSKKKGE